jgi:hypothetical protein
LSSNDHSAQHIIWNTKKGARACSLASWKKINARMVIKMEGTEYLGKRRYFYDELIWAETSGESARVRFGDS